MLSRVNYSLTQLEYVMAVHKYGHFAKAAEACRVTQPTLSMQIQKLESNLGVVIFDRAKKPVLLTDVGRKIIGQIQAILFEANKIEGIIRTTQGGRLEGQLVFGVIPTIAPYLLPRLLPILEKAYPGIELRIQELQTHRIIEALNNDEVDVGVLATPLKIPRVFEQPLYYESFSVLCKKGHALGRQKRVSYSALKSLGSSDLWLLEEGHCLRNQMVDVCSLREGKDGRKFKFESGSLETLKRLINSYGGYTLLPSLATDSIGAETQLVPFEKPEPAREIGLVFRREHHKKELVEALGDAILRSLPESVKKIRRKDVDILPVQ